MKKTLTILLTATLMLGSCMHPMKKEDATAAAPHLEKRGNVTQLIVQGQPWLALACELGNSTSSSRDYLAPYWQQLKEAGVNTVLAVVSWEQTEPLEGQYDFTVVDNLLADARAHDMKLALLWFGSWKNGITSYTPTWVKKDTNRFPLAQTPEGKPLPILSTLGDETCKADGKAFAAMMRHLKQKDAEQQTVIMIQMENEVGLHGHPRDYCPLADKAYREPVPQALTDWLTAHRDSLLPETMAAWEANGCKTEGTWEEVFAPADRAAEIFMAWNYASYMDRITAAGKAEYDLPTFVNAWIVQPEDTRPGNYPSGGPQAQNHDIWRAAAPHIDILSPDIYLNDFPEQLDLYARSGNPVFIPESRAGQGGAANAAYAIGAKGAIGYSPFGYERSCSSEANATFHDFYQKAGRIASLILQAQAEGRISAVWLKGSEPMKVKDEMLLGDVRIQCELISSGMRNGGAPQLTGGTYAPDAIGYAIAIRNDDDYLFLGSNVRITFLPADGDGIIGLAKVTEGDFSEKGVWQEGRWLNGDEIQLRYDLLYAVDEGFSGQGLNFGRPEPSFQRVELFKY
ncbi:MAG: beta-galactosidase [Prevotella sp.]|nr:beta-galactosidase [Prevotella sp.]